MTENAEVSIVVLTRNSVRTIIQCLQSIMRENPGEVLAVDGLSTDGTLDVLRRYGVRTIIDYARSVGYARRLGVEAASQAFVMFVDSDVELAPGCVSRLRSDLEKHGWAGIHANLLSGENSCYWQRAEDAKYRRKYGRPGPATFIDTSVALFRREDLVRHPFDPYFKESSEDVDLSNRLIHDNRMLGVSAARAYHHLRRGFLAFARQRFNYGLGTARLGLKYRSISVLLSPLSTAFSETLRAILNRQIGMIPYCVAGGVIKFLGVVVGVSNVHRSFETDLK